MHSIQTLCMKLVYLCHWLPLGSPFAEIYVYCSNHMHGIGLQYMVLTTVGGSPFNDFLFLSTPQKKNTFTYSPTCLVVSYKRKQVYWMLRPFFITWFTDFFLIWVGGRKKKFLSFFFKFSKYLSRRKKKE